MPPSWPRAFLSSFLSPGAPSALVCTALAKRVSDRLSAMTFEENRMQALTSRIFLGAALALVLDILVFVEGVPLSAPFRKCT